MKVYKGKWYFAIRFKNDLCIGLGKAPQWMRDEAVRGRRHFGV